MPATIGDLLAAHNSTAKISGSRTRDSSSTSTDFNDQLKDAQEAQAKPAQSKEPARHEATKSAKPKAAAKKSAKESDTEPSDGADDASEADAEKSAELPTEPADEGEDPSAASPKCAKGAVGAKADKSLVSPTGVPANVVGVTPTVATSPRAPKPRDERVAKASAAQESPANSEVSDKDAATVADEDGETSTADDPDPTTQSQASMKTGVLKSDAADAPEPAAKATKAAKIVARLEKTTQSVPSPNDSGGAVPTPAAPTAVDSSTDTDAATLAAISAASGSTHGQTAAKSDTITPQAPPEPAQEVRFAQSNHENIVTDVRGAVLAHGGTMQIRLDPPELGALQVSVEVRNGTINATFQTSNDDATRLLSHSLGQLKTALEAQGVTVDKIQVRQTPRDQQAKGDSSPQQERQEAQGRQEQQRDQQRKEMMERLWAKVSGQPMPVDMVA